MHNLSARLRGFELDPFAAWMAQVFVEAAALPLIVACGRRPSAVVTVCDSLSITKINGFDLVVGNPPFGRLKLAAERREYFREASTVTLTYTACSWIWPCGWQSPMA